MVFVTSYPPIVSLLTLKNNALPALTIVSFRVAHVTSLLSTVLHIVEPFVPSVNLIIMSVIKVFVCQFHQIVEM